MRSTNPALSESTFDDLPVGQGRMSLIGTINKTLLLLLVVVIAGSWSWSNFHIDMTEAEKSDFQVHYLLLPSVAAFLLGLITTFAKRYAAFLAPLYALAEGVALGSLSVLLDTAYPGIAGQAAILTGTTLFGLLMAYLSGMIEVTENFKLGIVAATFAIVAVHLIDFLYLNIVGSHLPFMGSDSTGWVSIGISGVVVVVAALNLVLDFDFIETGVRKGSPRYMEWYAAFGIMVTIVWLYVSLLKLLRQLKSD